MTDPRLSGNPITSLTGCSLNPVDWRTLLAQAGLQSDTSGVGPREGGACLIGHHNLHSLYLAQRDRDVRRFYESCDLCYVDGMGVLWLLRAAGLDMRGAERFSLMDCLPDLLTYLETAGLSVFYLGASPDSIRTADRWISAGWPQLTYALHHGYLGTEELDASAKEHINAMQPDVLLVGMGMPRQEAWILRHRDTLMAGAILQAGGTLDYYTGTQARPPRAISRLGLAWLYRLLHSPRRLGHRYLITPWSLLAPVWRLRRRLRAEKKAA
jgi:N-acetylglucosaminyldiphosphoundecaprenol N-acetyl-beta-D-mannosaminyltransferase